MHCPWLGTELGVCSKEGSRSLLGEGGADLIKDVRESDGRLRNSILE